MTTTKRFISLFMAVLMTFSLLAVSASAATARRGFNVSYRMDGENIVETIVFSGATMIRTVTPAGTMTIKTIENGSTSTAKVNSPRSAVRCTPAGGSHHAGGSSGRRAAVASRFSLCARLSARWCEPPFCNF